MRHTWTFRREVGLADEGGPDEWPPACPPKCGRCGKFLPGSALRLVPAPWGGGEQVSVLHCPRCGYDTNAE